MNFRDKVVWTAGFVEGVFVFRPRDIDLQKYSKRKPPI